MNSTYRSFLFVVLVLALAASLPGLATAGEIAPELATKIASVDADELVRVILRMEEQAFVTSAMGPEIVQTTLKSTAARSQEAVLGFLESQQLAGNVAAFNSFWLVNMAFAEVKAELVDKLAALPGVAYVYEDVEFHALPAEMTPVNIADAAAGARDDLLRWDHLAATFAPEVWEKGFRGEGITVAVIDTGVDISHPELADAFGGTGPFHEGYWAEFDRDGNIIEGSVPHDTHGHGTHVSGTIAGRNVAADFSVAPKATLAHGLVIPNGSGSLVQVIAGMQWAADRQFDIINGSLGAGGQHPDMATATDNLVAAGVVPIFANGNLEDGQPDPPGMPGNTPSAIAIGGYDADGTEAYYNRGDIVQYPGYEYDEFTRIKPDISAPGVDILSAYTDGRYAYSNGTSMAAPHVAGIAALLLSARPDLTVEEIREALYASTGGHEAEFGWEDIPTKDIHFGWGRVNALRALEMLSPEGPEGPGALVTGRVLAEDAPLAGATVTFIGAEERVFTTDEAGYFAGELAEGFYTITAAATAYTAETREMTISATDRAVEMNFLLEPAPLGTIVGTVFDAETGQPLPGVDVDAAGTDVSAETAEDGTYALELPEGTYSLSFGKPGYFDYTEDDVPVMPQYAAQADAFLTFGRASVTGTVVDGDGNFVDGVVVRGGDTETVTDEAGAFALDGAAGEHTVEFSKFGFVTKSESIVVRHGIVSTAQVEMAFDAGTVAGRVVDGDGEPIAGATVFVDELDGSTTTDADGFYELYPVTTGSRRVTVEHEEYWSQSATVSVAFEETATQDFTLQPLNKQVLFFNTFDTQEEQDVWEFINYGGILQWEFTEERSVSRPFSAYHASRNEFGSDVAELSGMFTPMLSIPESGATLTFQLWGEVDGLNGVGIKVHPEGAEEGELIYSYSDILAEWMEVSVDLSDYAGQDVKLEFYIEGILVMYGRGIYIDDVEVYSVDSVLDAALEGIVTDEQGRPVADATVTITELDPQGGATRTSQTTTGEDGAYSFSVDPGGWTIRVGKDAEYDFVEQQVYVEPDGTTVTDFNLEPYVTPTPVALDAQPGNGTVSLRWQDAGEHVVAYRVYRSLDDEQFNLLGVTREAEFTAEGLQNGHEYYFRVTVVDTYGLEGEPAAISATPSEFGPKVSLFDVQPRSLMRGGSFVVSGELDHTDGAEAVFDVHIEATIGAEVVGEWASSDVEPGAFEIVVDAVDVFGQPWAPNIYQVTLYATDAAGRTATSNTINVAVLAPLPQALSFVLGNNPFNPTRESQMIEYALPAAGEVTVGVYTLDGRRVRTLVDEAKQPGQYVAFWDGTDNNGSVVLGGMYVVRVHFTDADGQRVDLTRHSVVVK